MLSGYAGPVALMSFDPSQIAAGQYDFLTLATHELAYGVTTNHVLGATHVGRDDRAEQPP